MQRKRDERNILLASQAIDRDRDLSARAAAVIYGVDHSTLGRRRHGQPSRRDSTPKSRKLTDLEESVVVQYILDLDARAFPPRLASVTDMENRLLHDRDAAPVDKSWASNFIKRQEALKKCLHRKYDYQRAQCEDLETISTWFRLVQNITAKYGIQDEDIYNFDETGFMMESVKTGRGRPLSISLWDYCFNSTRTLEEIPLAEGNETYFG